MEQVIVDSDNMMEINCVAFGHLHGSVLELP